MTDKPLGQIELLKDALAHLAETVDSRAGGDPGSSYTAKLLSEGPLKSGKKLAEEAVELALAVAAESDADVASEAADVLYHLLVALRARSVPLDAVAAALIQRQGMSGLEEKASRAP